MGPEVIHLVEAALPNAIPDAVARLFAAQIPYVDAELGVSIVDRIATTLPPSTWIFDDEQLDRWPGSVAKRALAHVRTLPPGKDRILALCLAASHLTLAERREALDGVLDGTLPESAWEYVKPAGYRVEITHLVRTLPVAWQDEWLAGRRRQPWELREIGRLEPEIDDELTDAERCERVAIPRKQHLHDDPRLLALHLQKLRNDLPRVPVALRREWLELVLGFDDGDDHDPWATQPALLVLLPVLSGEDHQRAVDALVASVIHAGHFATNEQPWELVPGEALPPLLWRQRDDPYAWRRDDLIEHVIAARSPELVDRCLQPLLDDLAAREPDACLETVTAMTPWLAKRSDGTIPRALAELPVPPPSQPANPQYNIARVFRRSRDEDD